ncbi:hypothetical protein PsalN5692_01223 [Piscirickettsia salmonis]|uniref:hypothetical protein n=1 Tax=Piscirickettsia salmonis TaxID=1238 RepID=UPI0012B7EAE4|nr:hypothetical protein [Piscirickettsia salmonis]QGP49770.1 hypothetical protein PsalN5692_01223 [Piscirickettsia salmonis]
MTHNYAILQTSSASCPEDFYHAPCLTEVVNLDTPAVEAFIDFKNNPPLSIFADAKLDDAIKEENYSVAHTLIVKNQDIKMLGLVSSRQLHGELPVRISQDRGTPRSNIPVNLVMFPIEELLCIDYKLITGARVGHIVDTLHNKRTPYLLVRDNEKPHIIRGMFSAWQLSKQIGTPSVANHLSEASSLAELSRISRRSS